MLNSPYAILTNQITRNGFTILNILELINFNTKVHSILFFMLKLFEGKVTHDFLGKDFGLFYSHARRTVSLLSWKPLQVDSLRMCIFNVNSFILGNISFRKIEIKH